MSRLFLTGLHGGGTGLEHVALLSMVCEEYLAVCVCFIDDKLCSGTPGRAGSLPQQAATAGEGLCSLLVTDAAWSPYPRVPRILRKTACLLPREFSGTRPFLCTDSSFRKAALALLVLCGLGTEGGPRVGASCVKDASGPVCLLCCICVQGDSWSRWKP